MLSELRRKLEVAARVLVFSRSNPSPIARYEDCVTALEDWLTRATALVIQERAGLRAVHVASLRRRELRHALQTRSLPVLVRIGKAASHKHPDLAGRFVLPDIHAGNTSFQIDARALLSLAVSHRAELNPSGLTDCLLEDVNRMLAQFEEAGDSKSIGRQGHIGARANLEIVTHAMMEIVQWLDGLNRYRFRADPERLSAWDAAKGSIDPPKEGMAPAA